MAVGKERVAKLAGVRSVRLDDARLTELLDQLDEEDLVTPGRGRRQSMRYSYRLKELVVTLYQPGGTTQSLLVPARNISSTGFAFLHGGFVHTGTKCTVQLITTRKTRQGLGGRVVRCKHVEGRVHEIGIRFDQRVDVAAFAQSALERRVLVVEGDPSLCRLLSYYLKELHAEVTVERDCQVVVEQAVGNPFDLILLDLDAPGSNCMGALGVLRSKGYEGAVVALTASTGPEERERCLAAGFDDYQEKPVSRESLAGLLAGSGQEPLRSSLSGGPEVERLISAFVGELGEKARAIKEALARQDVAMVGRLARSLKGDAGSYGFEPIAQAAKKIEEVVGGGEEIEALTREVKNLVALCLAARGPGSSCGLEGGEEVGFAGGV